MLVIAVVYVGAPADRWPRMDVQPAARLKPLSDLPPPGADGGLHGAFVIRFNALFEKYKDKDGSSSVTVSIHSLLDELC